MKHPKQHKDSCPMYSFIPDTELVKNKYDTGGIVAVPPCTCSDTPSTPADKWEIEFDRLDGTREENGGWLIPYEGSDMDRVKTWIRNLIFSTRQEERALRTEKVTRIEIIDHTRSVEEGGGRIFTHWNKNTKAELSFQDDDRTLKIFLSKLNSPEK